MEMSRDAGSIPAASTKSHLQNLCKWLILLVVVIIDVQQKIGGCPVDLKKVP